MKKGIAYEFLVRLVIAVLFVGLAVWIVASIFRTSEEASTSFDKFSDVVGEIQPGEFKAETLAVDNGGALLGFTKTADKIVYIQTGPDAFFSRPVDCTLGQACLCLCTGSFARSKFLEFTDQKMECGDQLVCKTYEEIDFPESVSQAEFFSTQIGERRDYTYNGGFIIDRAQGSTNLPHLKARLVSVNIERTNNTVRICDHQPCVS